MLVTAERQVRRGLPFFCAVSLRRMSACHRGSAATPDVPVRLDTRQIALRTSRAAGASEAAETQRPGPGRPQSRPAAVSYGAYQAEANTITTRRAVRALRASKINLRRKLRTQARAGPLPAAAMASTKHGAAASAGRGSRPLTSQRAPSRMRTHEKRAGRIG